MDDDDLEKKEFAKKFCKVTQAWMSIHSQGLCTGVLCAVYKVRISSCYKLNA